MIVKHILLCLTTLFSFFISAQVQDSVAVIKLEMNTSLSEISADFSGGYLYFYRNKRFYHRLSKYYDFHRISKVDANSGKTQKSAESLSDKIKGTSHYHEGPAFIDKENGKIFLTLNAFNKSAYRDAKKEEGLEVNRLRLVEADFADGEIFNIKEFPYNDPAFSIGHATYSNITKRLYFASTRRGGKGGSDIFYSQKLKDGSWLEPVNLGRRINTSGEELFPYVKDTILFFSSNKMSDNKDGDQDIYYISEYDVLTSDPEPMPRDINSDNDDFGFCFIDSSGKYIGYFTSNRNNVMPENDDIYRFKMDRIITTKKYTLLVNFINQYGESIDSASIILKDGKGNIVYEKTTKDDGVASFYGLKRGEKYKLFFSKNGIDTSFDLDKNLTLDLVEETFQVNMPTEYAKLPDDEIGVFSFERSTDTLNNSEMKIVRNEKDRTVDVRLKNIHFALNSAEIFPYSARKLDFIVEYFRAIDAKFVYLEAHTDSRSSNAYNLKLSERRALSTRDYLVKQGIPSDKIRYKGMGETKLLNKCGNGVQCSDAMHLENRRIEFKLGY